MRIASAGVHGQLTSSMSATSGPTASRAAATEARSVWWSFTPRNPCATAAAAARATSAGRSNRARLAYAGIRGWTRPPSSSYTGTPRTCPARSQSASSTPLIANMPRPRRPNRSVARCSRSTSRSMSVGGSPSKSGPSASCTTAQTAVGAPSAKASPQPTSPSSVATRTSTCFPSRAVHGEGGSVGCQGIPSGTASTAAIFTGEPRDRSPEPPSSDAGRGEAGRGQT